MTLSSRFDKIIRYSAVCAFSYLVKGRTHSSRYTADEIWVAFMIFIWKYCMRLH